MTAYGAPLQQATDATWNPVRDCTKITPGCDHYYAETFAERPRGEQGHPDEHAFDLGIVPEKLAEPLWVENAEDDRRQLDERPPPSGGCRGRRGSRLLGAGTGQQAQFSGRPAGCAIRFRLCKCDGTAARLLNPLPLIRYPYALVPAAPIWYIRWDNVRLVQKLTRGHST